MLHLGQVVTVVTMQKFEDQKGKSHQQKKKSVEEFNNLASIRSNIQRPKHG